MVDKAEIKYNNIIYFDNASTTKPHPYLKDFINDYFNKFWLNPSSIYSENIRILMDNSKQNIINYLKNKNFEVYFTPSATFSNNLAIFGLKNFLKNKEILIFSFEHPSLINPTKNIEAFYKTLNIKKNLLMLNNAYKTLLKDPLNFENLVYEYILKNIKNETGLVILSFINNEFGFKFNLRKISYEIKKLNKDLIILVDLTQGFMKFSFESDDFEFIDIVTASSHKFHSLKGTGLFIIKKNLNIINPIIFGGGQENSYYPSTENTLSIFATNEVIKKEQDSILNTLNKIKELKKEFISELERLKKELNLNLFYFPDLISFSPYIIKFFIKNTKGEIIVNELAKNNIFISTSSACSSRKEKQINYIKDFGFPEYYNDGGLRVSFSIYNNSKEIETFFYYLKKIIKETFLIF